MKALSRIAFALLGLAVLSACETSDVPKKPKPVPPSIGLDSKSWNRPMAWENNARYGNFMPNGGR
jgi:hypothetical protein